MTARRAWKQHLAGIAAFLTLLGVVVVVPTVGSADPAGAHRLTERRCAFDPFAGNQCWNEPVAHTHPKPKPTADPEGLDIGRSGDDNDDDSDDDSGGDPEGLDMGRSGDNDDDSGDDGSGGQEQSEDPDPESDGSIDGLTGEEKVGDSNQAGYQNDPNSIPPPPPSCPAGTHSNGGAGKNCHPNHDYSNIPCGDGTWSPGHGHSSVPRPKCPVEEPTDDEAEEEDEGTVEEDAEPSDAGQEGQRGTRSGRPQQQTCGEWESDTLDELNTPGPNAEYTLTPAPDGCNHDFPVAETIATITLHIAGRTLVCVPVTLATSPVGGLICKLAVDLVGAAVDYTIILSAQEAEEAEEANETAEDDEQGGSQIGQRGTRSGRSDDEETTEQTEQPVQTPDTTTQTEPVAEPEPESAPDTAPEPDTQEGSEPDDGIVTEEDWRRARDEARAGLRPREDMIRLFNMWLCQTRGWATACEIARQYGGN